MASCDAECDRINLSAPAGHSRRLRGPELLVRNLQSFSVADPSLVSNTSLPDPQDSRHAVWPPPRPSAAERFLATMPTPVFDERFSGDWWRAAERDKERAIANEQRWAAEEAKRQEASREAYEAAQRKTS